MLRELLVAVVSSPAHIGCEEIPCGPVCVSWTNIQTWFGSLELLQSLVLALAELTVRMYFCSEQRLWILSIISYWVVILLLYSTLKLSYSMLTTKSSAGADGNVIQVFGKKKKKVLCEFKF